MNRILFSGTKSFWKTKNSVEVTIIEHVDHDVFEIIVVDIATGVKAEHVFVDAIALYAKLEPEFGSPAKGTTDNASEGGFAVKTHTVSDKAVSTFICNHLFIKTYLPVSEIMEIEVRSAYMEEAHKELMVPRPADLPWSACAVQGSATLPASPSASPEQEERRRPLIFTRVSQGLPLSESDAQIWARFAQNKTQQELVDAMARTLAVRVPEDEKVLQSAAHAAIMLPAQTPFPAPRLKFSRSAMFPEDTVVAANMASPRGANPSPPQASAGSPSSFLRGMLGLTPSPGDRSPRSSLSSSQGRSRSSSSFSVDRTSMHSTPGDVDDPANNSSRALNLLRAWGGSLQRGLNLHSAYSTDDCKSLRGFQSVADGASAVKKVQSLGALADAPMSRENQPSGVWPTGSPSNALRAGGSSRAARRHSYHPSNITASALLPTPALSVVAKPQHRRALSGSVLAGIVGSSNRVQPDMEAPDGSAETACGLVL